MSLLVERMVSELNRILNGEKQRQIAPASHILTHIRRRIMEENGDL
jgi:hypothetical protein